LQIEKPVSVMLYFGYMSTISIMFCLLKNSCSKCHAWIGKVNFGAFVSRKWYVQQQQLTQYLPANGTNCVTAQYTVKSSATFFGWTITVDNRAQYDNGDAFGGELCARVPDASNSAKLAVAPCFLPSFLGGPYWVLAYNEKKGYTLVSGG